MTDTYLKLADARGDFMPEHEVDASSKSMGLLLTNNTCNIHAYETYQIAASGSVPQNLEGSGRF